MRMTKYTKKICVWGNFKHYYEAEVEAEDEEQAEEMVRYDCLNSINNVFDIEVQDYDFLK